MRVVLALADIGLYAVGTSKTSPNLNFHYQFDCSQFRDPIGQRNLRGMDGKDAKVQAFIMEDPRLRTILSMVKLIAADCGALTDDNRGGKWTTIAFTDHHGRYISAAVAELVAKELDALGVRVGIQHAWALPT